MDLVLTILASIALLVILILLFGPRPTLDPSVPATSVPAGLSPSELATWLAEHEAAHGEVIDGAEATIQWTDGPEVQDLCGSRQGPPLQNHPGQYLCKHHPWHSPQDQPDPPGRTDTKNEYNEHDGKNHQQPRKTPVDHKHPTYRLDQVLSGNIG